MSDTPKNRSKPDTPSEPKKPSGPASPQRRAIVPIVVTLAALLAFQYWATRQLSAATVPYSTFYKALEEGRVTQVVIEGDRLRGLMKPADGGEPKPFVTVLVDPKIAEVLAKHGVEFRRQPEDTLLPTILGWVLPVVLFALFWMWLLRRMAAQAGPGQLMTIGKSRAKVYVEKNTGVTFADVAGVDEAKQELQEVVAFLKDPKSYGRLGARMPKGVLLVGPPGTGKTLLARAVAGEAGVPFFSISGSEFVEMFVGVGAARVRDLFEQARKSAPCIIFIDELDAVGRARGVSPIASGHDEKEQTLNQLLVEMDGFDPATGIVLIGATNRPEILDPALLRPGRFDRQILVDRPDRAGRRAILEVHVRRIRLGDVDLDQVAAMTPGFTGADLANLVNEAAILATRRGADAVEMQDFTAAIERIVAGLEKRNRLLNPREREIVAHHEMGHAIAAEASPTADPVQKVSIIPRGIGALGYTIQRPTEDRYLMTREELEDKMTVLLGGRAAERLVFGHLSTGAADDLQRATEIARSMATRYAMVESLGPVTYDTEPQSFLGEQATLATGRQRLYSEATAEAIDRAVREAVEAAERRALAILRENEDVLRAGAARLLECETLEGDALREVLDRVRRPEDRVPETTSPPAA